MEKVLLLEFQEVLIFSMGRRKCKEDNGLSHQRIAFNLAGPNAVVQLRR